MQSKTFRNLLMPVIKKRLSPDFIERLDRNIKTVAGVDIELPNTKGCLKIFIFSITDAYEFITVMALAGVLSIFFIVLAVMQGQPAAGFIVTVGLLALTLSKYTSPLKKFKDSFFADIPDFIDTMIQGLSVGLPVETVLEYTVEIKNDMLSPFVKEAVYRLNAGESLESALKNVSVKTLSPEFERIARILTLRSQSTADMVKSLQEMARTINLTLESRIISKAENSATVFFIPILIGYVIPYLVLLIYPMAKSILSFMSGGLQ